MKRKINGVVFYQGPSRIDGSPIVGIAIIKSVNEKTGNIVQTYILKADEHPFEAIHAGTDSSICGNCPLRGKIEDGRLKNRACYVLVHNGPSQVYKAWQAGNYPRLEAKHAKHFLRKGLRYGSYGDPSAIPITDWKLLESLCTGRVSPGYTHLWRTAKYKGWKKKIMASVHSVEESQKAQNSGWRTFRIISDASEKLENEIYCPATAEGGFTADCAHCGACNGKKSAEDGRKNIVVLVHGTGGKKQMFQKLIQLGT